MDLSDVGSEQFDEDNTKRSWLSGLTRNMQSPAASIKSPLAPQLQSPRSLHHSSTLSSSDPRSQLCATVQISDVNSKQLHENNYQEKLATWLDTQHAAAGRFDQKPTSIATPKPPPPTPPEYLGIIGPLVAPPEYLIIIGIMGLSCTRQSKSSRRN